MVQLVRDVKTRSSGVLQELCRIVLDWREIWAHLCGCSVKIGVGIEGKADECSSKLGCQPTFLLVQNKTEFGVCATWGLGFNIERFNQFASRGRRCHGA